MSMRFRNSSDRRGVRTNSGEYRTCENLCHIHETRANTGVFDGGKQTLTI